MVITRIERQKNDDSRYSVYIDGEFKFGLSGVDVLYYKLNEGNEITQEQYDSIFHNTVVRKAKDAALRLLSYSMRTEREITRRLYEKGFSEEVIVSAIESLKKYSYIDDEKYAAAFVHNCVSRKHYGRTRIKYELTMHGVESDLAERILDESDMDELKGAKLLIEKKLRGRSCDDYKEKRKVIAYLSRYGYPYGVINDAICEYQQEVEGDSVSHTFD